MDWTQLVREIPFLAAFIYFSLEMNRRYQASMEKRDTAYLAVLADISKKLDDHDKTTAEAIATMKERTRPVEPGAYQRRKTDRDA